MGQSKPRSICKLGFNWGFDARRIRACTSVIEAKILHTLPLCARLCVTRAVPKSTGKCFYLKKEWTYFNSINGNLIFIIETTIMQRTKAQMQRERPLGLFKMVNLMKKMSIIGEWTVWILHSLSMNLFDMQASLWSVYGDKIVGHYLSRLGHQISIWREQSSMMTSWKLCASASLWTQSVQREGLCLALAVRIAHSPWLWLFFQKIENTIRYTVAKLLQILLETFHAFFPVVNFRTVANSPIFEQLFMRVAVFEKT